MYIQWLMIDIEIILDENTSSDDIRTVTVC